MLILSLLGCGMGSFTTDAGPDRVRGALYFLPDSTLSLELYEARQAYVILANSTLPCWPEDDDDDPETPPSEADQRYWDAQKATMTTREGGLIVAFSLALAPDEDWLGRYALQSDAWETSEMADYVEEDGRVASGAWLHVLESAVDEGTGLDYALSGGIEVLEEEHEIGVGAPAWVEVERKDTALAGTFDLAPTELSGSFVAEHCDNLALLGELYQYLALIAIADGALEEDTETDTGVVPPG